MQRTRRRLYPTLAAGLLLCPWACTGEGSNDSSPTDAVDGTGGADGVSSATTGSPGSSATSTGGTAADATSASGTPGTDSDDDPGGPVDLPPPVDPITTVADLLTPFDTNASDRAGPGSWSTNYGKSPEIIARAEGPGLLVFAQNYRNGETGEATLLRLMPSVDDYVITAYVEPPMLDRVMGMDHDDAGQVYLATGIYEKDDLTGAYPPPGEYRSGIVSLVSTDLDGTTAYNIDVDIARGQTGDDPELIINPMVAATSRLRYGGGSLALLHGINTDPDDNDVRHQKALGTYFDAVSGEITKTSSVWVSHSFDQRLLWDGQSFVEMHLGDAYPRYIALAQLTPGSGNVPLFHIKGDLGANVTRTLIGDVTTIDDDPTYGYLALFVAEPTDRETPVDPEHEQVAASRELAVVRVQAELQNVDHDTMAHLDSAMPDTLTVTSSGQSRTNRLRWLTDYDATTGGDSCAERPKLVDIGGRYIVLWERWDKTDGEYVFEGTWAMLIDANGATLEAATRVSDEHLSRGDDAIPLEGGAAWITGDESAPSLKVNIVAPNLEYRMVTVE